MRRCCDTCSYRKDLVKWDYSQGGCVHTKYDGFACLALASEGNVIHMVGIDQHENDGCEMWSERKDQKDDEPVYLDVEEKYEGIPEMVRERIIKDVRYTDGKFASYIMGDLVRCRDCAKVEEDLIFREYWCDGKKVPADHFCGYAVKKGD